MGYPRYRFDQRFDSTAQAAAAAAAVERAAAEAAAAMDPLDRPTRSERDLLAAVAAAERQARAEGIEQGRRDGEAAAAARIEAALAEGLERLDERLAGLESGYAGTLRAVEEHGSALMVALVRRLAPRLLECVGRAEAEALAADALRLAGKSPVLRLRVHPDLAEPLRARLVRQAESAGFTGTLDIVPDAALVPGAVDAAWEAGGLRHDPAAVERTVAELCERALAALGPTPEGMHAQDMSPPDMSPPDISPQDTPPEDTPNHREDTTSWPH